MNELLQTLTEAVGVSGVETNVRTIIRDLIEPICDSWRVDTMGNLVAYKKGTGESDLRVLVDAHMDEVGLMVTGFDSHGCLEFDTVGGIHARALIGKVVQVGKSRLKGVIGVNAIHKITAEQRKKFPSVSSLRIDIGAKSKEQAQGKAKLGDRATFVTKYQELGNGKAIGKAFDNRAGCAVLIELLKRDPYPFDLYAVFSVQEEVGIRGVPIVARSVKPDAALIFECTPAYDLPTEKDISTNVALGKGASLYVMDSRTIQDPQLVRYLRKTADTHNLPYQIRQPGGGGTNSGAIQRSHTAASVATIAVPGRYAHTPVMMIDLQDYETVIELGDVALRGLTRETITKI